MSSTAPQLLTLSNSNPNFTTSVTSDTYSMPREGHPASDTPRWSTATTPSLGHKKLIMSLSCGGRSVLARSLGFVDVWGLGMCLFLKNPSCFELAEGFWYFHHYARTILMQHFYLCACTILVYLLRLWFGLHWDELYNTHVHNDFIL